MEREESGGPGRRGDLQLPGLEEYDRRGRRCDSNQRPGSDCALRFLFVGRAKSRPPLVRTLSPGMELPHDRIPGCNPAATVVATRGTEFPAQPERHQGL